MEKTSFPLEFYENGLAYKGWATPSDKRRADGSPASYHVVLNEVFFGNLSRADGKWQVDEQRPHILTEIVGKCLDGIQQ